MKIDILTLFPEMLDCLNHSIVKRAIEKNLVEINVINIRDFSAHSNKNCDDYPYGGGAGMVMMAQPIVDAFESVKTENTLCLYTSPKGRVFNQSIAKEFSMHQHIVILCGHYEGVDERALEMIGAQHISIGDYVLTGGELASAVIIDATLRHIKGVIKDESLNGDTFCDNLLEYPQYTRPDNFRGKCVPEILLSGHHAKIQEWRKEQSIELTKKARPDLLVKKQ